MVGMLAGVLAFLAMSGAVVIGAQILYDPERSYHHSRYPRGNRALETTARSAPARVGATLAAETEVIEGKYTVELFKQDGEGVGVERVLASN